MNNHNINAAGKPQTIRTTLEKLSGNTRRFHAARRDDSFRLHLQRFSNPNMCYAWVNGITIPVSTAA